jgi:hypothetical protein
MVRKKTAWQKHLQKYYRSHKKQGLASAMRAAARTYRKKKHKK